MLSPRRPIALSICPRLTAGLWGGANLKTVNMNLYAIASISYGG